MLKRLEHEKGAEIRGGSATGSPATAGAPPEGERLAGEHQRHLVCAPFSILSPTFQTISARIRQGDIGMPCLARARYGWAGPSWNEWFYKPGGGCLFDLGVYCIASLTGLLGPAQRVMAMTGTAIPEREVNGRKVRVEVEDTVLCIQKCPLKPRRSQQFRDLR